MFQTVDLRLLRLASRFEDPDAFDPAASHRRDLLASHRRARRDLWAGRLARLRSRLAVWTPNETGAPCLADPPEPKGAVVKSRRTPESGQAPSGTIEARQLAA
jgi:hypothetical protein